MHLISNTGSGSNPKFTRRAILRSLAASAASAAVLPAGLSIVGSPATAQASRSYIAGVVSRGNMTSVWQWTDAMLQTVRDRAIAPPPATRLLATGHMAGFLARAALEPGRYAQGYRLAEAPAGADPDVAYGAAVATAIRNVTGVDTRGALNQFLSAYPDGEAKGRGVTWGEYAARALTHARRDDGYKYRESAVFEPRKDELAWQPTGPHFGAPNGPKFRQYADALLPGWGYLTPWSMGDITTMRPSQFPSASSREFARQLDKIKALGSHNSTIRTDDQSEVAFFWEDGPRGVTPPGHWQIIAMQVLQNRGMDGLEQARAMALLSMAQADAAIATWDCKFEQDILRPETAIRVGVPGGLHDHMIDRNWMTLIPTPNFPAYTSGHSTFSATSAQMLKRIIGTDRVRFSGQAPDLINWPTQLTGVTRSWTSLSQAAAEGGHSREYGGIHWEADDTEGQAAGRQVADHVFRRMLRRT
ncbi:vanadium-dependent haloperoxidase [Shimia ponticola]|uniref:vanadium-dependent haloperoxidase n=1 Tax=Shimia ponticola TaxID=2582893 RepID=UPI00164CCD82|nr:vanadium-dependent haloperoxidase [Shimia ponticola]